MVSSGLGARKRTPTPATGLAGRQIGFGYGVQLGRLAADISCEMLGSGSATPVDELLVSVAVSTDDED